MKKSLIALLVVVGWTGIIPIQAAPRKIVDRTSGTTVLQPNYLNQKTSGYARPIKVTYTACIVQPAMESAIWEKPQFTMACMRSEDEFKFQRGPLLRSRGQNVSGLGLTSTRLSAETKHLLALEAATKPASPASVVPPRPEVATKVNRPAVVRIDKSGFLASTQLQPAVSSDCCGGSPLTLPATPKTIRGILR